MSAARETAEAKAIVKKETAARLAAAPPPSSSSSSSSATGSSSKGGKAAAAAGSCPIVEGSTTVTATTTRSAVAWGSGAAASKSSGSTGGSSGGGSSSVGGGGSRSRGGGRSQGGRARTEGQDAFWCRPLESLAGGEFALRRQVEGGVSNSPPGTRRKDKVPPDLNLSRPWSAKEEETYTRVMLEEGSKNFYALQVTRTPWTRTLFDLGRCMYPWTPRSENLLFDGEQHILWSSTFTNI